MDNPTVSTDPCNKDENVPKNACNDPSELKPSRKSKDIPKEYETLIDGTEADLEAAETIDDYELKVWTHVRPPIIHNVPIYKNTVLGEYFNTQLSYI